MPRQTKFIARGFTLLEMIAVLFVIGMASSIVIPNLPGMQASFDFALKRESFEQAMNGLAYTAFKNGQDYRLIGDYDANGQLEMSKTDDAGDGLPGKMKALSLIAAPRVSPRPVIPAQPQLPLPDGWILTVAEPIHYRASGYCTGGVAELKVGRKSFVYRLRPPFCELSLENG